MVQLLLKMSPRLRNVLLQRVNLSRTIVSSQIRQLMKCTLYLLMSMLTLTAHADQERVLHLGNTGEPQTLDPHKYNLRLEETLLNDLFLGLTTFDAQGNIAPGAATSWTTSEDGLEWTFTLRSDLTWSDGVPITSKDFVYSMRRLQNPATAASLAYFLYMIENAPEVNRGELPLEALGVSAPDDNTLVIRLSAPYPYLLERLLYPTGYPVPAHSIKAHGDDWVKAEHWVSNGAYTLAEWRPQSHIALQRNPNFFAQATIEKVFYHPVTSEQNAYNRFRNNELHAIATFPVGQLEKVSTNMPKALRRSDLLSMMYLVFNTKVPALADQRVRQALSLAVDQSILTDKVLRNGAQPAFSFAPSLLKDYTPALLPHKDQASASRIQQAKTLLAEAGYGPSNPLKLTLRHVSAAESKKVTLAVAGMWRRIGVQAQLQQADIRTHFGALRQGEFDVAWAGWIGESNAEHYLTLLQSDIGNVNYGQFANADYDTLLKRAQSEADYNKRNQYLSEAEAHVVRYYAVIPLYTSSVRRLVSPELKGWVENLRDMHQTRYLSWQ